MKLGNFTRIIKGDYPKEYESLISLLAESYNGDMEAVFQALNRRLTIDDNFLGSRKEVEVRVDANGNPLNQTFVTVDFGTQVKDLYVGKATNLTNSNVYPTSAPFVSWANTANGIQILNVKGLPAGNTFRLRLIMSG